MIFWCKFKSIFGKPGKGVHNHILGIAYIDVLLTILLSIVISIIFPKICTWYYCLLVLFILSIIFHRMFCVRTTVDKLLF